MNRLQSVMAGVLVALCTACVASSGGGGGGGGSGTSQDATDSTGADQTATADAVATGDGTATGDATIVSDAGSSGDAAASPADTAPKDGATAGDSASTDAAVDAQQGSSDGGPAPADAGPIASDGGPAPADGGPKPVDGGPVGPASCDSVCKNIAKANCPSDDPFDKCMSGCQKFLDATTKCPPDKVQAFLACATDTVITCKANGESEPPVSCEAIMKELVDCLGGGGPDPPPPPDPCNIGTCYAGGMDPNNPSGKPQCGCSSTCNGNTVAIDCDGNQCFCTLNGQKQAGFEQGTTCDNPQTAMTTVCGKP